MLDLSTLTKFNSDIKRNHATSYPLIIIGLDTDNPIYISTIKEVIVDEEGGTPFNFKDYNLKISNIKESLNLESHAFKISNVTISLNNYEQNGVRLSDSLSDKMNFEVDVYYKTQSCIFLSDCLSLYRGIIRRIGHDDTLIKIILEDLTDSIFHKDVPIANLGTSRNCFSKDYLNRYIPITYGAVSKAPVFPYIDSIGAQGNYFISIIPDDVEDVTESGRGLSVFGFSSDEDNPELIAFPTSPILDEEGLLVSGNDKQNPLYIYKGDYFRVLKNYEKQFHNLDEDLYAKPQQYTIDASQNFLKVEKLFSSGFAQNPPASNEFQTVKVFYPSQAEILRTEAVDGDYGADNQSRVINLETSIYRPDASFDNNDKPSLFFDEENSNEFDTYSEIPYNEIDIGGEGEISFSVNGFRPSNWSSQRHGIHYPVGNGGEDDWVGKTNYLYFISAWLQVNAHWLDESVKFISMPTGDLVINRALAWIQHPDNGYTNILTYDYPVGNEHLLAENSFLGDNYGDSRIVPQYCLNNAHQTSWAAAGIIPEDATHTVQPYSSAFEGYKADCNEDFTKRWNYSHIEGQTLQDGGWGGWLGGQPSNWADYLAEYTHEYFPADNNYDNLKPSQYTFAYYKPAQSGQSSIWNYRKTNVTNKNILRGHVGNAPCYYPSAVYKVKIDADNLYNSYNISHILVGQWNNTTMGDWEEVGLSPEGETWRYLWVNMFYDEQNDTIPYLFKMDDFAVFTPTQLTYKNWGEINGDELSVAVKYYAKWNGNEINTYKGNNITYAKWGVSQESYANGYGLFTETLPHIKEQDLCSPEYGGMSWWMYIDSNVPAEKTFTEFEDNIGEWTLPKLEGKGTIVPRGCLIPCNHKMNEAHGGMNWEVAVKDVEKGIVSTFGDLKDNVTISVGSATTAEVRLGILFPFSDISSQDAIAGDTKTFVYGKLKLFIPEDTGDAITHNMDSNDTLLVQAYASETTQSDTLDYNALFVGGATYATNLITLDGYEGSVGIFNDGDTRVWEIGNVSDTGVDEEGNEFTALEDFQLEAWDSPDKFDAISLVYRVIGTDTSHHVQLSTDVHSIGIIQFSMFENALNDDLYADVMGRANNSSDNFGGSYKYVDIPLVDEINAFIENPADIIYHMIEKELNQIDVVNRDSWVSARESSIVQKLGFSITDKINSKKLIEDIAKNTNLFPKFGNNGEFYYKTIEPLYVPSSVNIHIEQKDIIKFSFKRTPIENVITMANIKFRKDYAEGEYTRQTGYCDAYDFFGNGEDGGEVLRDFDPHGVLFEGYNYSSLGVDREKNILEFESDYIRNYNSAKELRNFLLMQNCNQHTIIKSTLPLKYINMEVGDIVDFDKLNNNTKAYGEDYTISNIRNAQVIYPYFIVTSVTKSAKDIKIECFQLHMLERTFSAGIGSLSRRSELGLSGLISAFEEGEEVFGETVYFNFINGDFTLADINIFEDIVAGQVSYLTSEQKKNSDITGDGSIDQYDLNAILALLGANIDLDSENEDDVVMGDVNGDGLVNVVDIVAMISYILHQDPANFNLVAADLTGDGTINVVDIVAIISMILDT